MPTIKNIELIMSAQPKPGYTEVKQNDADGVQLSLSLKESNGTAYIVPSGATVSFLAVKKDGHSVVLSSTDTNPRVTYAGNKILVTLSAQVLAVAGIILCNAIVSKDGATTSTQTFTLSCAEALTADDLTSSSEFQSLSKMLADLTARKAEFDAINDKIANMALGYGGTFATLAALQADANANTPDGKKRFYIIAANGHHYYWSNITSAWADGGAIIPYADVVALKNDVVKIYGEIGIGIEYGCEVLPSSPPASATVYVTAGVARLPNGQTVTISGQTVTIYGYGHGIIFINSSGAIDTLAGDDVNDPVPATPDGALLLASVYLYDGTKTLDESNIADMRKFTYGLRSYVKNTTYESIGARMNAIEEDAETLEARVAQAETDIDDLQTRTSTAESDIDDLQNRVDSVEDTVAEHTTQINGKADKVQEAWIAPTLLNNWTNYGESYSQAGYFKDSFGIVHLRGFVKGGSIGTNSTTDSIFYLPSTYRPPKLLYFVSVSNNTLAVITIALSGAVNCIYGNNAWLSLDGLTFRAT
jgi:hypothetical protein